MLLLNMYLSTHFFVLTLEKVRRAERNDVQQIKSLKELWYNLLGSEVGTIWKMKFWREVQ